MMKDKEFEKKVMEEVMEELKILKKLKRKFQFLRKYFAKIAKITPSLSWVECGIIMGVIMIISLWASGFWVAGSVITSSVKTISDDCGKTYGIEKVLAGNWFCPEKEK